MFDSLINNSSKVDIDRIPRLSSAVWVTKTEYIEGLEMNLALDDICSLVEGMKAGNGDWNLGIRTGNVVWE